MDHHNTSSSALQKKSANRKTDSHPTQGKQHRSSNSSSNTRRHIGLHLTLNPNPTFVHTFTFESVEDSAAKFYMQLYNSCLPGLTHHIKLSEAACQSKLGTGKWGASGPLEQAGNEEEEAVVGWLQKRAAPAGGVLQDLLEQASSEGKGVKVGWLLQRAAVGCFRSSWSKSAAKRKRPW